MLRAWRLTFLATLLFVTACSDHLTPQYSVRLTPASVLHADFAANGALAIGTLEQVAVYSLSGELQHLLELPRAQGSWHPIWLMPDLLAVKDGRDILLWRPAAGLTHGPWRPREHLITNMFQLDGRLLLTYADGVELLQREPVVHSDMAPLLSFVSLTEPSPRPLQQATSDLSGVAYRTYAGGLLEAMSLENQTPLWQRQLPQQGYIRALDVDNNTLYLITQDTADPFARGRSQKVVQVDVENGKVIQSDALLIESQATTLLSDPPYLYIGGSENCLFAVLRSETSQRFCYPRARRWGKDTGQVIALYQNTDTLFAVTSSGHLQIWNKHDIVSLLTDK